MTTATSIPAATAASTQPTAAAAASQPVNDAFQSLDQRMQSVSEKIEAANKVREEADNSNKFWAERFDLTAQGALAAFSAISNVLSAASQPPPKAS